MKKPLPIRVLFSIALGLFLLPLSAQDLKRSADDGPQKGHNLYKQSKLYDSKSGPVGAKPKAVGDRAMDRLAFELRQLRDPATGKIPDDIQSKEAKFSERSATGDIQQQMAKEHGEEASRRRFFYWRNRGPANVGGRTRALALDMRNENIILAGGVSGGLWRSTNSGDSWRRVTRKWQSPSITAIAQDPRKGRQNVW